VVPLLVAGVRIGALVGSMRISGDTALRIVSSMSAFRNSQIGARHVPTISFIFGIHGSMVGMKHTSGINSLVLHLDLVRWKRDVLTRLFNSRNPGILHILVD